MNDINRRQMRDVMVPQNDIIRRQSTVPAPYVTPSDKSTDRITKNPFFKKSDTSEQVINNKNKFSAIFWVLLVVILLGGGFVVANYFSRATVNIVPVTRSLHVDRDFAATKEGTGGEFDFKFIRLEEEKTKDVPATDERKIQKKASGKVVIFNWYDGAKQRLIKNTRLESTDHKIFRIDESVVVPGAKVVGGKVTIPGSIEALVYADVSGKEYNIGLSDFTIPGFKGDPRYSKFNAKSKADSPIGGGFSGTVNVPSEQAISVAQEELKQDLKKIAIEKVRAQIPDGVTFFPGSMVIKFEEIPQEFTATDTAKVSMRAVVFVFFFDTIALTKKLSNLLPIVDESNTFTISDMSSLVFSFVDPVDNVVLSDVTKINFHINGDANFVGQIDTKKIREALAGKSKKDFSSIMGSQSNIGKGTDAVIRPMWKTVFPADSSKITVKITN